MVNYSTLNTVFLGIAFMFIFTAFTTCGNIEQTVLKSLTNSSFSGSGYNSLAIIYGVFSASSLIAPSVVALIGPQFSMLISGVIYSGYIAVFIKPITWTFYVASVLIGLAAAVLWTAQGNFLVINSDSSSINKNTGVFWALLQCSMLFGNLYIYLEWNGKEVITDSSRTKLFVALSVLSLVGTAVFILLRKVEQQEEPTGEDEDPLIPSEAVSKEKVASSVNEVTTELKAMLKLFGTKSMLLLSILIAYSGLELTFYSGVYGTCIGATKEFGAAAKGLIGISGILVGAGEIIGGGMFGLVYKNSQLRRTTVIFLGFLVHFISYFLIYLNLPPDAPIVDENGTRLSSYLAPSEKIALLCSFLLGLGDSCFNTQLYSILGTLYADQSAPAVAIFKFIQSIWAAIAFFYSNYLLLTWQLLIMVIFGFTGTISFFLVEKMEAASLDLSEF
ncbi:UNC93-like protein MFSD11 [Latimeria chalumnae]|nr:PREDICTED: UNC93-like protein MFSD11 [Latimeria chalumnae]|eukprot:XP_006013427.1 PREDICTED: UNC93-like protein MFSD11 [Latimeria chalumnae]